MVRGSGGLGLCSGGAVHAVAFVVLVVLVVKGIGGDSHSFHTFWLHTSPAPWSLSPAPWSLSPAPLASPASPHLARLPVSVDLFLASVWSTVRHPSIVTFLGCYLDDPERPLVVMEYMEGGTLQVR